MLRSLLSFGRTGTNDYLFPKVDPKEDGPECLKDCADCTVKFPSKVKVETSRPLYGQIKEFHTHVLVATGQSDWKEKHVEKITGSLMQAFDEARSDHGVIKVSASNLTPPEQPPTDESSNQPTTIHRPPHQPAKWKRDHLSRERDERSACELDYVILLCSHGRRDARCGITAPLIKRELERHLRPLGLNRDADDSRPGGVGIFFVSHVGGHKFSANVLIYRKKDQQMIWLARVRPEHCEGIVKYTVLQGKVVHPESQLRGGFDRVKGLTSW
ncbi:hypothetical protein N7519_009235 [Penicillium mononematosum]|uniref:uncharacterized protein n=1 Tax=Penicillium mononematosum TaxID=268346 RepID=UPI0025490407|nr:uncharacterized protein N7519_009235 [Penicillium mononematosum]KAJ6178774.1 hypothetical protein N7519_009235 [Penicillium mononematosum]